MQKKNCFTSLICAAIFLFFLFQCNSLSETAAYWPRMICVVGLVLSVLETVLEGIKWVKTAGDQEKLWPLTGEQTKRSLILLGLLVLWIAGLTTIGFLVSSIVALCAIAIIFEPVKDKKHLIRDIVVCVLFGILFYITFKFLGIHFPRALLI
ncbi:MULTISPECIES: tripartite tricarboxylate transporter TctB family protein [unclassified Anaerotruncus]|uniref:tripartite tricarboxylate transporter TctB family protein n=1 Tax=unclassified Anaerotruncus TaxID=2641626 RepID=UPI00033730CA|nr:MULTISPECIES: tripartite tricarboxylate transporter TctB family protein [unclassified Anaerotruncus]EOS64357.1 hypothetical protein C814_00418 [Anaerotruncus sp. G3(2012)]NBK20157.1 hypothetical protein [Anaerotruncus sp. 1XD42-93]NCE76612.1 hypothetical protein [Anaerotruncus sp. X29]RKJ74907.1 hypothetical protein D7Y41_34085 [Anaerotruncus sp. 1XD22-93]